MLQVFLFFAKAFFVGGALFFIVIGLINGLLVATLTAIVRRIKSLEVPSSIAVTLFYVYLYCSFGAFYSSLATVYGGVGVRKWFISFLCLAALSTWIREARKSAAQTIQDLGEKINVQEELMHMEYLGGFNKEIYQSSMTVSGLRVAPVAMVAYFTFLFKPDWIDLLFGNWPNWLATIFS